MENAVEKKEVSLESLFETDKNMEKNGIRFLLEKTGSVFIIKRFGGANSSEVQKKFTKFYKPFAKLIEKDLLPSEQRQLIETRVFVESSVLGWENVKLGGVELPFTSENAVKLFSKLPDLLELLVAHASDSGNFKEDLGN